MQGVCVKVGGGEGRGEGEEDVGREEGKGQEGGLDRGEGSVIAGTELVQR